MAEIAWLVALPFDLTDGRFVAGEPVDCPSPAVATQTAQGQWKVFGHAGAISFSRASDFEKGKFASRSIDRCRDGRGQFRLWPAGVSFTEI